MPTNLLRLFLIENELTWFNQKSLINLLTIYRKLEVFISSTIVDLKEEREAVEEVMKLFHINSFRSECFMASPHSPKELCLTKASECDIFIGIYKNRYGQIPTEDNPSSKSIPEMEYDVAIEKHKPIFLFQSHYSEPEEKLATFLLRAEGFTHVTITL
jgi:hypothetical protein